MRTHRVLLLIDRLGQGGAARVVTDVALGLDRSYFSPFVCTTRLAPANGQDEALRQAGVPLVCLERRQRWSLLSWRPLWDLLPTVSILHSHESGSNLWGRAWGRLRRVPVVITQDHTAANEKRPVVHLVDRALGPLSDRIVTVSQFDRQLSIRTENLPPDKVVTIYNGIDVSRFPTGLDQQSARARAGLPEDGFLVAIIARLAHQKNHAALFQALSMLPEDLRTRVTCLVVGTGELQADLKGDVRRVGLDGHVLFLGQRPDVPVIMSAVDLMVLPSRWECLPMVVLEALASRCPVVATAVGGVPEILEGIGWPLVQPDDAPGLAQAIEQVLLKPASDRMCIADAGYQRVRDCFGVRQTVAQVEALYHSLLGSASGLDTGPCVSTGQDGVG